MDFSATVLLCLYGICHKLVVIKNEEITNTRKRQLLLIRILFGFLVSAACLATVSYFHQHIIFPNRRIFGLFVYLVTQGLVCYLVVVIVTMWFIHFQKDETRFNCIVAVLRFCDLCFDIGLLVFCLILSDCKWTEFSITTTTLACFDIFLNLFCAFKNLAEKDYLKRIKEDENEEVQVPLQYFVSLIN